MKFFDRFKSRPEADADNKRESEELPVVGETRQEAELEAPAEETQSGFFSRLKKGLKRTSSSFSSGMGAIFLGKKEIDDELLEDLETQLLVADVGIEATQSIMDNLARQVSRKELFDSDALYQSLQKELAALLKPSVKSLVIDTS